VAPGDTGSVLSQARACCVCIVFVGHSCCRFRRRSTVCTRRRSELRTLFANSLAGLVFVTAFASRDIMRAFVTQIAWESEVWIADDPMHLIHFNGERCFAPYHDAMPGQLRSGE
jgi:hypothetical protein